MSTARVPLAEVFNPWERWEGVGSGFESLFAGGGANWKSRILQNPHFLCGKLTTGTEHMVFQSPICCGITTRDPDTFPESEIPKTSRFVH